MLEFTQLKIDLLCFHSRTNHIVDYTRLSDGGYIDDDDDGMSNGFKTT